MLISRWNTSSWTPPPGMAPALRRATEVVRVNPRPTGRLCESCWVLDYNFSAGERVRLHSPAMPWQERPARVVHLYPPGLAYWEAPGPGAQFISHCAYLLFSDAAMLDLERLLAPRPRYARFVDDEGLVGELLSRLAKPGAEDAADGYWRALADFYQIIALLHRAEHLENETYRIRPVAEAAPYSALVEAVRAYLHEHLAAPITLAEIAGHLGISESALSHRYRAEAGETPLMTLKRERISLVKVLLAKGYPLKAITEQVGFYDPFHLSKAFKQLEGVSPRAYQRNRSCERNSP